ncbi:hypothetical protein PAXINDRAFT_13972 [Paxillus involutus ATCC 200175]|uniref:Uncharacterized protein n=1 Tax=Paxillus involutus ATCC 200175 TaxID=664439 RepID=A0A0C9U0F4_PAXIN|nr:hypothetical protein PAXINDRAFT_13972 [Paxillus involutus ATCC 200175]
MPPVRVAGAIEFSLYNRYLPWSTLEGDLQKHGYKITNWPSGVPRENDKGINTLSAGHTHKLYVALMQDMDEGRPRFVRRACGLAGDDIRSQCARLEEKARERSLRRKGKEDEMDYQTLLREAADLSSFSWLLNPPVDDTAPQSNTFANVAFNLLTSPGSYPTFMPPRSHDSQSTYEGILPEANSSANVSSGTTFLDHPPQNFVRQQGTDVNYPVRIQEGTPASDARLSASVAMRGSYTSENMPNPGETVLCDDLNFVALSPGELDGNLVCRVTFLYWALDNATTGWHACETMCPKARELWLQMIEGNDDVDEIWLWVDGDDEWLQHNRDTSDRWPWPKLKEEDWVAAQSALRRRIERTQLTPCPVPKTTAHLTLEHRAQLQGATPAQRFAAIDWLVRTSRRKEDSDFQLGLSSKSKFGLGHLIYWWFHDTPNFRSIARFPEQPEAYKEFEEKRKAMGCKCLDRDLDWYWKEVSEWVGMMRWLRPAWNLDVECIRTYHCDACKSRAAEIYDRLYGDDHSRDIPLLPIQLAFSLHFDTTFKDAMMSDEAPIPFFKAVATKSLSPNAQREADRRFWPLCTPGERDTRYSPWVNAYPDFIRETLAHFSGEVGPYSRLHSLPPVQAFRDEYLDELPVGFADDAPNLITLVGTVIWISACRFLDGTEDWHWVWEHFLGFKEIVPLPELAGIQVELRNHLKKLWSKDSSCFRHIHCLYEDNEDYVWTIYAAIVIYVKSLNLGPKFEGCPECHAAYLTVVTGSGSGTETSLAKGSNDRQLPDPIAPSTRRDPVLSPFHRRSLSPPQADDINGPYLSPSLFDVSLSLYDRQNRFNARLRELIARAAATDLYVPSDILHMPARPDTQPTIPTSSSSNIVELDTTEEQQNTANSTQPGDTATLRFNAAPTSNLKKRHKIAKVKEILIDMLREINFPLHNRYLPWSTLEGDLQKHGYEITNWPSGVPRENDKGIHTLSAGHVHKLYLALTQARVEDRPRFIRRVDQSTDQDQGMTPVPNGPGPKRRLGIAHNGGKGKRTKFKVTTAEYYASQSTDA